MLIISENGHLSSRVLFIETKQLCGFTMLFQGNWDRKVAINWYEMFYVVIKVGFRR